VAAPWFCSYAIRMFRAYADKKQILFNLYPLVNYSCFLSGYPDCFVSKITPATGFKSSSSGENIHCRFFLWLRDFFLLCRSVGVCCCYTARSAIQ
jgi:hypothetical protein